MQEVVTMFKRAVSAVLIPVMLIQLSGCMKTVWIGPEEIRPAKDDIKSVRTVEGERVNFDSEPQPAVEGDTIYASVADQPYQIALDQIESARVRRANVGQTLFVAGAIVSAAVIAVIIWSQSDVVGDFEFGGSVSHQSPGQR